MSSPKHFVTIVTTATLVTLGAWSPRNLHAGQKCKTVSGKVSWHGALLGSDLEIETSFRACVANPDKICDPKGGYLYVRNISPKNTIYWIGGVNQNSTRLSDGTVMKGRAIAPLGNDMSPLALLGNANNPGDTPPQLVTATECEPESGDKSQAVDREQQQYEAARRQFRDELAKYESEKRNLREELRKHNEAARGEAGADNAQGVAQTKTGITANVVTTAREVSTRTPSDATGCRAIIAKYLGGKYLRTGFKGEAVEGYWFRVDSSNNSWLCIEEGEPGYSTRLEVDMSKIDMTRIGLRKASKNNPYEWRITLHFPAGATKRYPSNPKYANDTSVYFGLPLNTNDQIADEIISALKCWANILQGQQ